MADGKKSFILYADIIHTVSKLPKDKAGELFMHILEYVNDKNPETDDLVLTLAFEPIKQQLKRDLKRWESIRENKSKAGKASAIKRQQVSTGVEFVKQEPTHSTVNVNDNVNVTVNEEEAPPHNEFAERLFGVKGEQDRRDIMEQVREQSIKTEWVAIFNAHLRTEGKKHYHYREWLKHLRSWLVKKLPELKNSIATDVPRYKKLTD